MSLLRYIAPAILAAILLIAALPAYADADEQPDDDGQTTDEITVRTVAGDELQRDDARFPSGLVTRIRLDDIRASGGDLSDALERSTGVYVRRQSTPGQPSHLSIRGANPRQAVVELDGLRLSSPVGLGFDASTMPVDALESIDVHRGTTAVTHGGGALAGAVGLNPRTAPDDGWEMAGRLTAGSFYTGGVDASAGVGDGEKGVRVHAGADRSTGDFLFVDEGGTTRRRINNDHRRANAGTVAHLDTGGHRLRLTGMYYTGESGSPGPSEFQSAFEHARLSDYRGLGTLRWDGPSIVDTDAAIIDAHAAVGAQQRGLHYENPDAFLTRNHFESNSTRRTASATGGLVGLFGTSHLARLDVEGRLETHRGTTESTDTRRLEAMRRTAAVSAVDEWFPADGRVSLIGGLRAEIAADSTDGDTSTTHPLLPAAGVIGRLHRWVEVRANVARTFRMPDFDELYLDAEGIRGDADLDPERAWTFDTAIHLGDADRAFSAQVAAFFHRIDSTILFLPVSAYLIEAQNLDDATARGFETSVRIEPTDRVRIDGGYTYTRAFVETGADTPAQLPGTPRHRLAVEPAADLTGLSVWSTLPEVRIRSAIHYRSRLNLDRFGNIDDGPALRVDVGATAKFLERFRAGVHVRNLFDHRGATDSLQRPLPGRAVYGSVEVELDG